MNSKSAVRKIIVVLTAVLLVGSTSVPANAQDAFNPDMLPAPNGTATFQIGEDGANIAFSMLAASRNDGTSQRTCESLSDPECSSSKADYIGADAVLKVCASSSDNNCVVRLEMAGEDGIFHAANFVRNTIGMNFPANASRGFMGANTPSLWSLPQVPSASGTTDYAVIVRADTRMDWNDGRFKTYGFIASVRPYRAKTGNYKSAYQFTTEKNFRGESGIAVGGHNYECAWSEDGTCGVLQDFAPNTRVKLTVRITSEVGGWFNGRIKDPVISVAQPRSGVNEITVEAAPAVVQRMFYQTSLANLTPTERSWAGGAGTIEEGFVQWAKAPEPKAFSFLSYFRNKVQDKTAGVNTFWNFASSGSQSSNSCLGDTSKVLGIVTTNSMAYNGGTPQFKNGFLNYEVAGLHYQPDGITKVQGSYDLVMRSEVARCLYGFSRAPLSATISVVGDGDKSIATTVVSEKNGWLKLAAYGFTFSKKTIRAKITKAKPTSIVCVSASDESKVRNIRAINPKCPKGFVRQTS